MEWFAVIIAICAVFIVAYSVGRESKNIKYNQKSL